MADVVVCGVAGRMGQRLASLVMDSEDLVLAGGTERTGHEVIGKDVVLNTMGLEFWLDNRQ